MKPDQSSLFHSAPMRTSILGLTASLALAGASSLLAVDPAPPKINDISVSNTLKKITWTLYPAAEQYQLLSTEKLGEPWAPDPSGAVSGQTWKGTNSQSSSFYQLQVTPLSSNALLTANVLNRLAYGPTPDELERVLTAPNAIGPQAYIDEQLSFQAISETLDSDDDAYGSNTNWVYVTATGTAGAARFYIYLSDAGRVYVDGAKLVTGSVAEAGPNLLVNGDFESALAPAWTLTDNFTGSGISTAVAHSGSHSLEVVATAAGTGNGNAIFQTWTPFSTSQQYTLSFWYLPNPAAPDILLTVRLSGGLTVATVPVRPLPTPAQVYGRLKAGGENLFDLQGGLADLRAWFVMHAVGAKRQLLEVLTQFLENHFVTQHSKTVEYLTRYYSDFALLDRIAADLEFREISRWREALLNPQCTFYDLLRISAESSAMVIYLDTVTSRGDGTFVANENYARELLELFTFGVDNGYDQNDIVAMSRAWTGWRIRLVNSTNLFSPFAVQATNQFQIGVPNDTAVSNLVGVWTFNYRSDRHNTSRKTIFPNKTVPARFGQPWVGRNYQLVLNNGTTTNSIQDGYQVLTHLANQPFTEEFISVKLCRLFVHDDFVHGAYNFADPSSLSPEGKLVLSCMTAWETSNPKGQLRPVLKAIFDSDLFRSHGGSMQKAKTPLEFTASAIRALRSASPDGTFTATTDGYSISGRSPTASSSPLTRMGSMMLFDRGAPDGYPEAAAPWISAGTLAERVRFVQTALMSSGDANKADGISGGNFNLTDPVGLLRRKLPAASLKNAGEIADYMLRILYPGEGKANLDFYRTSALAFLDTADNGLTASPFSSLTPGTAAYETRVRGAVAMLLSFPRFQEQ